MLSERMQNVLVALLAVVAVVASAFAMWSVNRPYPSTDGAGATAAPITTQEPADGTSATTGADGAERTVGQEGTADPQQGEAGVQSWVEAWSGDDADLLVVGDGFSNLPTQWLQLWAAVVGQDRPVTIHHWGEAADVSFNDPIVLSDGDGPALTVWSASRDGTTIHDAAERYQDFVDASAAPDAVLVTLGLDSAGEDIAEGLDQLVGEIDEDVPVLVAIGPEDLYDAGIGDALLDWSQENEDRVAVVDLRDSAPGSASAEQWADAFGAALGNP